MCDLDCRSWPGRLQSVPRIDLRCPNPCHCEKGYIRKEKGGPCIPIMECRYVRTAIEQLKVMIHGI
ncbi:hypothetical protein RP20_CCG027516 [Aedes albopictus]|nr:hypothetical protein RP20_CCG027516 [Aedes albopictus]